MLPLHPSMEIDVREHAFLAGTHSLTYSFVRIKGLANVMHGGEGMYMDRFVTANEPGLLLLHGYGNVFQKTLAEGEKILIEPGGFLYKDSAVTMNTVQQNVKTGLMRHGMYLAEMTGPAGSASSRCTCTPALRSRPRWRCLRSTAPTPARTAAYRATPSTRTCPHCGAPVDVREHVSDSGWGEQPPIRDMARLHFSRSTCQISGKYVPVADFGAARGRLGLLLPPRAAVHEPDDPDRGPADGRRLEPHARRHAARDDASGRTRPHRLQP